MKRQRVAAEQALAGEEVDPDDWPVEVIVAAEMDRFANANRCASSNQLKSSRTGS
jgi:hypothetical protein